MNSSNYRRLMTSGDSSEWSAERKQQVARGSVKRVTQLRQDPAYKVRRHRINVAAHLATVVAKSGLTRTKVADRAQMKVSQLCRALGDEPNLTLDTISRISAAAGWDYDLVFRLQGAPALKQPWEHAEKAEEGLVQLDLSFDESIEELLLKVPSISAFRAAFEPASSGGHRGVFNLCFDMMATGAANDDQHELPREATA